MYSSTPDYSELIKRCLNGDAAAQRTLYNKFSPRMLGVCERYTGSEPEAEDVLQDAFLRVFSRLNHYRNEGALEGWIYRIVVSTALNHYKKEKAHHQLHVLEEVSIDLTDSEADAIEQLSASELVELIKKLPDGSRVVFNLFAIEGYSHAEIAIELGIQQSTSKSQVCKARKMLVHLLNKQETIASHAREK